MHGHGDHEAAELSEVATRFAASERRSLRRRRPRRAGRISPLRVLVAVALFVGLGVLVARTVDVGSEPPAAGGGLVEGFSLPGAVASAHAAGSLHGRGLPSVPTAAALRRAWGYARRRGGLVSIGVVDTAGRLRSRAGQRGYVSASVVKAMLLVAEARRAEREGLSLAGGTDGRLRAMITRSDNDAADSIYYRVGDEGLLEVAAAAGMRRFAVAGHWANAHVTAADMARLFFRLGRLLAGSHRRYALRLLGSVIPEQRWGIPSAAGRRWSVRFKGGWRQTGLGSLVHQAAELRRAGRRLSIAVLTDRQPSQAYAIETVTGVARRLLGG